MNDDIVSSFGFPAVIGKKVPAAFASASPEANVFRSLVGARYNPDLKAKYQQLVTAGKPAKLAITAVMRKLAITANALLKADRCWAQSQA
ncbi:hypothetical protein HT136_07090 [Novosphingobium profundi]|uniref:hypothetical protein n=1 Tax=Novosphingobium profundi TaxID=1774954 RepID=UPI001BDA7BAA|nr:hypothetical protein [Novosphingobium profundi]